MSTRRAVLITWLLTTLACGGGGSPAGPSGPPPTPTPTPGNTVTVVVYYDEDGSGTLDDGENVRLPEVEVSVGGHTARTADATGIATVTGVPAGSYQITFDSLPPFYKQGTPVTVTVPQPTGMPAEVGLVLPIGRDLIPNVYMAFGDSITRGDGSSPGADYPDVLEGTIDSRLGAGRVVNRGADATNSYEGLDRIRRNLRLNNPAYTLILYGTNDWNDNPCKESAPCFTVDNLQQIVERVKDVGGLPVIGTIPPANPDMNPASRNEWVKETNQFLRTMANAEGAVIADVYQAFMDHGDLPSLFSDHVHPNDAGYTILADTFAEALITGQPTPSATSSLFVAAPPALLLRPSSSGASARAAPSSPRALRR